MTFTHIVAFKWQEDGFDDAPIAEALRNLVARFDGVQSYRCGHDAGFSPGAYDFGIVAAFEDRDSFLVYRDHPEHKQIVTEMILPNAESRVFVQLED